MEFRKETLMVQIRKDLKAKNNTTRNNAELVEEYLKETGESHDLSIFSISYINRCGEAYKRLYNKEFTLKEAQDVYKYVPAKIREQYGDNYLLGLIEFLKLAE